MSFVWTNSISWSGYLVLWKQTAYSDQTNELFSSSMSYTLLKAGLCLPLCPLMAKMMLKSESSGNSLCFLFFSLSFWTWQSFILNTFQMGLLSLILEVPILHCWWFIPLMICHVLLLAPLQPRSLWEPDAPSVIESL